MINYFNNIYDPIVRGEIDIYDFLDRVENPDLEIKHKIEQARCCHSFDKAEYDIIKGQLPCFTLNFSFRDRKLNSNIDEPTSFIYIDVDGITDIDFSNEYIFASWLSLSGTGRGILVKVDGLTLENFKDVYKAVTSLLNVKSDVRANKATQYCVQSYDKDLYFNEDSKIFDCSQLFIEKKNTPISYTISKKKRDSYVVGENKQLRFNNITDYDFNGEECIVFWEEKESIAEVIIPNIILEGHRESCISAIAYQCKALNPEMSKNELLHFISNINQKKCFPPLSKSEVIKIVNNKDKLDDIEPILNKERRIIFNPEAKLDRKQKSLRTNKVTGEIRKEKSRQKIRDALDNWNFKTLGKITQNKLIEISGLSKNTVEKFGKEFRERIKLMNNNCKT
ncbi:BT4734/BF3469 family protein [Chryseobacterium sp. Mn2064]|uniref:BT4734/BF3469 family protein n=1 Tax=Chryseobacterium sp. Mn2064 TaxID=3395263 RepID=UPI003BBA8C76